MVPVVDATAINGAKGPIKGHQGGVLTESGQVGNAVRSRDQVGCDESA